MDIPENPRWYPELDGTFVSFSVNSSSGEDTNSNGVLMLISALLALSSWLTLLSQVFDWIGFVFEVKYALFTVELFLVFVSSSDIGSMLTQIEQL